MKRLFNLMALAIFAATLVSGCQKYDDTQIRQEIKDLGERVSKLEAWCKSSQAAVDAVATLQEAVKNMRSVEMKGMVQPSSSRPRTASTCLIGIFSS